LLSGAPVFSQMIDFGDSLSDTGNDLYVANTISVGNGNWLIKECSGYCTTNGRFTSGTDSSPQSAANGVWEEELASRLYQSGCLKGSSVVIPSLQGGSNWAYGGAESGWGTNDTIADDVGTQVLDYLGSISGPCPSDALYTIWALPPMPPKRPVGRQTLLPFLTPRIRPNRTSKALFRIS
jgi:phospholipase/lecithinase/hemolysin